MNIKSRIWSLPLVSTIVFGIGLAVSVYVANSALAAIERTGQVDYPALSQAGALRATILAVEDDLKNAVIEGDRKRLESAGETAARIDAQIKRFGAIDGRADAAAKLGGEFSAYYRQATAATRIMLEMDKGDGPAAIAAMQAAHKKLRADLDQAVNDSQTEFDAGIGHSTAGVRMVLAVSVAVAALVIAVLAGASWFVVRAIWQQLGGEPEYARTIARAVAAGDLSISIVADARHGDSLLAALAEMQRRLVGIVSGIQSSAQEIRLASGEIASGNAELSSRTESQASNIGGAAQAMRELTATVQQNADGARHATELASAASRVAERGGDTVGQVVTTMNDISASSRKIADIISVIDGIAFQTNILALNAAVEAARAGEQGRGFAVVASEVRNLAQRSASAAKEIKSLIDESVSTVSAGSALVEQAGLTMREIVSSVRQVNVLIGEISNASQEQSSGLESLNRSVHEMDDATQRNAAMTEEAAAAAGSLQEQSARLSDAVGVFKLAAGPGAPASPARQAPALRLAGGRDHRGFLEPGRHRA